MNPGLILGDSLPILRSMQENSVEVILTDPPYSFDEATKIAFHTEFLRIARGAVIVFAPPENQWVQPSDQYGFWIKPISTKNTSRRYSRFVEMIHFYNGGKWDNSRHWSQYTNVFTDSIESSIVHPHQKPIATMERLVQNHSEVGDTVLDPFAGSGTVGVACNRTGRLYIGIEKDSVNFSTVQLRTGMKTLPQDNSIEA